MRTIIKNVENMQEIGDKRRKHKIYLIFIMTVRLARRLAGLLLKNELSFVSNQTYSCTCISSAIRNTIVNL